MTKKTQRWALIKQAEAYASFHKQALDLGLDLGINDNTGRDLAVGAAAGGVLGLGKHMLTRPDEDDDEEGSSLAGDVLGGAALGAGAGGVYNQTYGAPAAIESAGPGIPLRPAPELGMSEPAPSPIDVEEIVGGLTGGGGGSPAPMAPGTGPLRPSTPAEPIGVGDGSDTIPQGPAEQADMDAFQQQLKDEAAAREAAETPAEEAPAEAAPPAAADPAATMAANPPIKIDGAGELTFLDEATGKYVNGSSIHGKRFRAPSGSTLGEDGKLYRADGVELTDADLQPINIGPEDYAIDPAALPPGTTVGAGDAEAGLKSTNPGAQPTTNPGAQPNYGFTGDESVATEESGGGLAIYPGAKTTSMPGQTGYRVQQAYNEQARDAEAEKQSGYWTELASGINPLNWYGGAVGGLAAAGLTPTRSLSEQAVSDQETWKNILMPGRGVYNSMKRLGTGIRGPEIKELRKKVRDGDGDGKIHDGTPEEKEAGFLRNQLEAMELGHRLAHNAVYGVEKAADAGQAVDAPLGSMQQAYVADAVGADSRARASKQVVDHEEADDGLYNALIAQGHGAAGPIQKRIRHGASGFAESAGKRMVNRFDPTQLLSENPDATLTGLAMGTGKPNQEQEDLVAQRYAEVLKKYQAKLDPDAELTDRDTPWHRGLQGIMADADSDIAGHKYMRAEKPWQYWLNPLDKSGPLNELTDRYRRRVVASAAYPDSTAGRFGMTAGGAASLGLLPLLTGGEDAQQSLRRSAAENDIYADVADPDLIKKPPRDGDGDGMINDGTPDEKKAAMSINSITPGNTAMVGGLLGGGLGALTGAGSALYSGHGKDEEDKPSVINRALLGALAGGGLGAAGGYLGGDSLRNYVGENVLDNSEMGIPGIDDVIDAFTDSRQPPKEVQASAKKKKKRNRRKVLIGPGGKAKHRPYEDDDEEKVAVHLQSIISRGTAQFLGREEKQAARPGTRAHESTHADVGGGNMMTRGMERKLWNPNKSVSKKRVMKRVGRGKTEKPVRPENREFSDSQGNEIRGPLFESDLAKQPRNQRR